MSNKHRFVVRVFNNNKLELLYNTDKLFTLEEAEEHKKWLISKYGWDAKELIITELLDVRR